jgi:hypothetical protein
MLLQKDRYFITTDARLGEEDSLICDEIKATELCGLTRMRSFTPHGSCFSVSLFLDSQVKGVAAHAPHLTNDSPKIILRVYILLV